MTSSKEEYRLGWVGEFVVSELVALFAVEYTEGPTRLSNVK